MNRRVVVARPDAAERQEHKTTRRRTGGTDGEAMIELQLLAALEAFDRARERIAVHLSGRVGLPPTLAVAGGVALGWLARGLRLRGAR